MSHLGERCDTDTALLAELYSLVEASQSEEPSPQACLKTLIPRRILALSGDRLDRMNWTVCWGAAAWGRSTSHIAQTGSSGSSSAIKLIDLPLATELYRKQFRIERQILARLYRIHSSLACSMAESARTVSCTLPWIISMEYPSSNYCEQNQLLCEIGCSC